MVTIKNDEYFMSRALTLAEKAEKNGDVPVGAVVVKNGEIIGRGYNKREKNSLATAHAEIVALNAASRRLGGWNLHGCVLYVTLEPCPMCAGAIVNSRIERTVFGAYDKKAGCLGSVADFNELPFNHKFETKGGVMEKECASLLSDFFSKKRAEKKAGSNG